MGLTQEQEVAEVRAATRRHPKALKERATQASNKGKRPMKEGRRAPKRLKPSSASHRDTAEVSSVRRAQEESWTEVTEGVLPLVTISVDDLQIPSMVAHKKRARAGPSLKERTGPDGFSLAKVPAQVLLGVPEDAYISDIPSAAYAIARGSTLPANAAMIDDLPLESVFITELFAGVQSLQY
ncbi:hypothetical protein O6P43_010243 [Quillaja saponaria]|uniref:Uncharacterized protein n=1 Tax=Quillaja saponaria TaxID=32244 RepID=A0AAD7VE69_QUISA|nr:hypothetical protein O6P43_010243 [Quillaja saponaria]